MALRARKKRIAEVNLSSMTDIIFMLLIFFMLTSTLVKFLPFQLPKSESRTTGTIKTTINIQKNGEIAVNDQKATFNNLEAVLRNEVARSSDRKNPVITIAAEVGVTYDQGTKAMAVANRLKATVRIATEPHD